MRMAIVFLIGFVMPMVVSGAKRSTKRQKSYFVVQINQKNPPRLLHGLMDSKGEFIFKPTLSVLAIAGKDRFIVGEKDPFEKLGVMTLEGKYVIPPKYAFVHYYFSEGLMAFTPSPEGERDVSMEEDETRKYGYLDIDGNVVIAPRFGREAGAFTEGLAAVTEKSDGPVGYIDKTGEVVIPFQFEWAGEFSGGRAKFRENGKFGYIDKKGKKVIAAKFKDCSIFDPKSGLAHVTLGAKRGIIDVSGKNFISGDYEVPQPIAAFDPFAVALSAPVFSTQKFLPLCKNGKCGYLDRKAKVAIPFKFENTYAFSEGLAAVKMKGKNGYINTKGKMVIPPEYDSTMPFSEGLAFVRKSGKWGVVDKKNKVVLPFRYVSGGLFERGIANVNGSYVTKKGKVLWGDPTKPHSVD